MTKDEFDQAIEAIRLGQVTPHEYRVIAAAVFLMRDLRNSSAADTWKPTYSQILYFVASLDKQLHRVLKQVADNVQAEKHTLH